MGAIDIKVNALSEQPINSILILTGYVLAIMFILNVAFGNAIMNVITFGLPLNEMTIGIFLVLLASTGLLRIPTGNATAFLYLWLVFGMLFWLPVGFFEYGIVAGRDATQLLDCTVLFLAYSLFSRVPTFRLVQAFQTILMTALTLEFLDRVVLFLFTGVTVSSFQEVRLFGGTIGSSVVVISSFWFGILMKNTTTKAQSWYLIVVSLILVLLLQNRFVYASMIVTSVIYFIIFRPSFVSKRFLIRLMIVLFFLGIFESFVGSFVSSILSFLPNSDYLMSRRLFKYGLENFSLSGIFAHLSTGFGLENEIYVGAAGGVAQRLGWWYNIFVELFSSPSKLFLGLGYGIPLTDEVVVTAVREPHNSFVSVFARQGLLCFVMWFIFHFSLALTSMSALKRSLKGYQEYRLLLMCLLVVTSTYICGLVEPAFELPPIAIPTYMFLGLSLTMLGRLKRKELNH